jgi:uncharacterized membrane protein YhaH (DUF805 family)
MSLSEDDSMAKEAGAIGRFLTLRGTVSQGWYLAGLGGEFAILVLGVMSLAGLNNPTGGGSLAGAFFFPLIAFLLHFCLVVGRMRDAGAAYPVPLGIVIAILPFAFLWFTIEYIEYIWPLIMIGFFALYLGPIFAKRKAAGVPQS